MSPGADRADKPPIARAGLFLDHGAGAPDSDGVFGRDIAVSGFCDALLQHMRPGILRLFQNTPLMQAPRDPLPGLRRRAMGVNPIVAEMRALRANFAAHPFSVWHDLDGNLHAAHDLRQRYASRLYPITATPHVFSYAGMQHNWILRMLLQGGQECDAMICPTASAARAFSCMVDSVAGNLTRSHGLELRFRPRIATVPLGVDCRVFRPRAAHQLRARLGLPEDVVLVAWIGRFSPLDKADLLPLVQAFAALRPGPDGRVPYLLLGGSGPAFVGRTLRAHAAALGVAQRVIIRPVPVRERHLYHAAADIFVSPADSIQETFGITPIEAMACGVPQVVSDWDGYRETVVDGATGYRISTWSAGGAAEISRGAGVYDSYDMYDHLLAGQRVVVDPVMLRTRLQALVAAPALRRRLGAASRERALRHYDWPVVVRCYEALWDELGDVAKGLRWAAPTPDYAVTDVDRVFAHYPSEWLAPDTVLVLGEHGRRIAAGALPLPAYHLALHVLDAPLLQQALRLLAHGPVLLAQASAALGQQAEVTPDQACRHLLWMMKMDIAQRQTHPPITRDRW